MGELATMSREYIAGYSKALSELMVQQQMADLRDKNLDIRNRVSAFWLGQSRRSALLTTIYSASMVGYVVCLNLAPWWAPEVETGVVVAFVLGMVWLGVRMRRHSRWSKQAHEEWMAESSRVWQAMTPEGHE